MSETNQFPRGVEVIVGTIIRNQNGKLLLATGTKWYGKWVVAGGHVEPGETIFEAAVREGLEETGLQLTPVKITGFRELINAPDFHRPAHFIAFDCVLDVVGPDAVTLQQEELTEYRWVTPAEALTMDCNASTHDAIKRYIRDGK